MRKIIAFFTAAVLAVFMIPTFIPAVSSLFSRDDVQIADENTGAITAGSFDKPFTVSVYRCDLNTVESHDFEEYITGVLAGEMPPTYNIEALSAQAVAARSYILSKAEAYFNGQLSEEHHGAMICTNPNHCKAWRDLTAAKASWDVRYANDYEDKIRSAVKRTEGEYMTYKGEVVKAYFYAMSSGRTENVEDVWGTALPYLRSVDSREDAMSDGFESLSTFDLSSLCSRLKAARQDFSMSDASDFEEKPERTDGGSVVKIKIGNTEFKGSELREILGLRSANFTVTSDGDKLTFKVKGYGHGVGMSQNGANVLAERGMKYREILAHYYTDVNIVNLYKKL